MLHNEITSAVIDAAIRIHRRLGPGLYESVYRVILRYELEKRGFVVVSEQPIPVIWDDIRLDLGFRSDMLVNDLVLIETKSVEAIHRVHKKQVLTYLRLTNKQVGLLINFNVEVLKDGIHRIVNNYVE